MESGLHWVGLQDREAIVSPMVNLINHKMGCRGEKFSVGEFRVHRWARTPGGRMPVAEPDFPYKPPANSPPRRKPLSKRTPIEVDPLPTSADDLPMPGLGNLFDCLSRTSPS